MATTMPDRAIDGATGPDTPPALADIRLQIDTVDRELVALLNRRARLSVEVAGVKRGAGTATYHPAREHQVVTNVLEANDGPLAPAHVRAIWAEILSASRDLQRPMRVAYLGPANTFSHRAAEVAARVRFGSFAEYVPCRSFAEVFAATERGTADIGVVPVENSVEGAVGGVLDVFAESPLVIAAEIRLQITHFLVGHGPLGLVERVYSHPQALGQCRNWLMQNLPNAQTIETSSTANSAERAADDPRGAGISTEAAGAHAGVAVLARSIQDHAHNTTRFGVLSRHVAAPTGRDRTAILFATQHRPGTLQQVLRQLSERKLNLTRIESRPSRRGTEPWEYLFFVDFDGHPDEPVVAEALVAMRSACQSLKVLGAWPIEDRVDDAPRPLRPVDRS